MGRRLCSGRHVQFHRMGRLVWHHLQRWRRGGARRGSEDAPRGARQVVSPCALAVATSLGCASTPKWKEFFLRGQAWGGWRPGALSAALVGGLRHGNQFLPASLVADDGAVTKECLMDRFGCTEADLWAAIEAARGRLETTVGGTHCRATGKHSIPRVRDYLAAASAAK